MLQSNLRLVGVAVNHIPCEVSKQILFIVNSMVHSVFVDASCQQYADEKMLKRAPAEVCAMLMCRCASFREMSLVRERIACQSIFLNIENELDT